MEQKKIEITQEELFKILPRAKGISLKKIKSFQTITTNLGFNQCLMQTKLAIITFFELKKGER